MKSEEIITLTEKLLEYNQKCMEIYKEARERGIKQDFQNVIKPFVDEVKGINDEWKEKVKVWLKTESIQQFHIKRVDTTSEHIEQLSVQAFFPETSRSRFLNANRTVEYFLLEILKVNRE